MQETKQKGQELRKSKDRDYAPVREPVLEIMHKNLGLQMTVGEVLEQVKDAGHNLKRKQVYNALISSANRGLITKVATNVYVYRGDQGSGAGGNILVQQDADPQKASQDTGIGLYLESVGKTKDGDLLARDENGVVGIWEPI